MAVYVDDAFIPYGRMVMCHMMADTIDELHEMADKIDVDRRWFQDKPRFPHYDISMGRRFLAVELGAIEITSREMVVMAKTAVEPHQERKNGV